MKIERHHVNGWSQSHLLPPEHLRVEVTVHLDSAGNSARIGIDIKDHATDDQLGLFTTSVSLEDGDQALIEMVTDLLRQALAEHYHPF